MDFETKALAQFDKLVAQGEILWQDAAPHHISAQPFNFEFHIANSLLKKPVTAGSKKPAPAFKDTNKDFDLGLFGSRHKLILNKYCVVRPQMVLHTVDFEPQDDLLNADDFDAAWRALTSMGERYMVIFNGGKDAGASLNHKHLQVLPRPVKGGLEALLGIPSEEESAVAPRLEKVPFRLAVQRLPSNPTGSMLLDLFRSLRGDVGLKPGEAYNMILVRGHMIVIPRRTADIDGIQANAAGMTGLMYCSSEEQYQDWLRRGPMQLLEEFGVPK